MNIAELRNRLADIAAELAEQDIQQEDVAVEGKKDDEEHELEKLMKGSPIDIDASGPMNSKKMKKEAVDEVETPEAELEFAEEDDLEVEEAEEVSEEEVEETVEVPVAALEELMQLAGFDGYKPVQEYANEPEEEYMDIEDQLIGLSGGLNGPKNMHPAAAGGDNPMDQEPRKVEEEDTIESVEQNLYKSYKDFLEAQEIELDEEQADEGIQAVATKDGKIIAGAGKGGTSKSWLKNRDSKYDDAPLRQVRKDMK